MPGNVKDKIVAVICIFMSLFFIYASVAQIFESFFHRTIFVGFTLVLVFLTKPALRRHPRSSFWCIDLPLILLSIAVTVYAAYHYQDLFIRVGDSTNADIVLGTIFLLLVLEATRRAVGWPILSLVLFLLAYTYFGPYFPSFIAHGGFTFREIIELNYMTMDGVFGVMIGVVADFIIIFTIFGAFLEACGGVRLFTNLAQSLMGWQTGGSAKTAIIASGIMGSLSGSSAANVVTTGSFTIPMMKRMGYSPTFAGAVEAAASTGGQILPPIMGASAFVIMAILGISYLDVCKAAAVPAILYFVSIGICVHYVSKRIGLRGLPRKELPAFKQSFLKGIPLLIPVVVILGMLVNGFTAILAGFYALLTLFIITFLQRETRLDFPKILFALKSGSLNVVNIAIVCEAAGIIVSSFVITGLGMRISAIISSISSVSVNLALITTAMACIILGMGMPTVGAYIIVATLGAPALAELGISPIATHLFVFYYAILCNVTPPVALAAYAAAALAGRDTTAWKIGIRAFSFTFASFILPFIFIRNTALLLDGSVLEITYSVFNVLVAILSLNLAIVGFYVRDLSTLVRCLFLGVAFLLFWGDVITHIIGYMLFAVIIAVQRKGVVK